MYVFSVYNRSTGMVVRCGTSSTEMDMKIQAQAGEAIFQGQDLEPGRWRIVRGRPVAVAEVVIVTVAQIKEEQGRRLRYTDWAIARANDPTDGRAVPPEIMADRQAIRAAAEKLEAMKPIPVNYRDASFWT